MYDDEESEWDKMYEQMRNEKAWNYAIGIEDRWYKAI